MKLSAEEKHALAMLHLNGPHGLWANGPDSRLIQGLEQKGLHAPKPCILGTLTDLGKTIAEQCADEELAATLTP